ncbi:dolichyl-diphosphooligosaccharide--protein glycosyltransferase subunit 1-like [Haliotis rubra]|uniref:dolichyl-diphosphooligosaccharide--protein glycosyltransferase subunit 1-like n=1 Tax=Haliotis rubra TaxID=36100 RepID=UPI001EE5B676|nr:dolichyl-diphosphooligosaccharide--protein glycosyltransferase subunit 1-like [Haliotis rubra]
MKTQIFHLFLLSIFVSVLCKVNQDTINAGIVNSKVERKIDIASHLVKIVATVTIENKGSSSVSSFVYAVDSSLKSKLSFIGAVTRVDDNKERLIVSQTTVAGHDGKALWRVKLGQALGAGKSVTVEVETVFTHALRAYPAFITQAEKQLVVLEANIFFYSPYKTLTQTTTVVTTSSTTESYTKSPKPVSQSDNVITYGPYEEREPFTEAELKVHEENNSPFLTVTSMERIIEVSHWGNIAVEEHIDMLHSGAVLKGPFSRFDYQRNQDGVSSIKSFKTFLPAAARDVYYRDEIGNISTSNVRESDEFVEFEIRPRFPLFGGWKTHYYIGYNVPSYEYLYNQGDKYALKMRLVDHVYDDMIVDELTVRIILPEGAKNIDLKTPYDVKKGSEGLHFTYLDTVGRPVIVLHKNHLVEQHIQNMEVHYTFQKMLLLQEPLLVVGAFYLLFLLVIIYVRLDFSITKDEAKESRMRVASLLEEVQSAQDKRSALYQSYDDAINKFKSSKDSSAFTSSRKKIDSDYKQLTQQIQTLQTQLKNEGSEASEKVGELQRLDTQYKEQINLAISFAERLVASKISRQQYLDAESGTSSKREDIYQKMETLRANL